PAPRPSRSTRSAHRLVRSSRCAHRSCARDRRPANPCFRRLRFWYRSSSPAMIVRVAPPQSSARHSRFKQLTHEPAGSIIRPMAAELIDGTALAESIKNDVRRRAEAIATPVRLCAVLVGGTPAGELYANRQADACRNVGIQYQLHKLPADIAQRDLQLEIRRLNADASVTGIMMH